MEIHATRAWKIQSRAFVRRKKVGICIVSGFQVCWSLLNIEGVPTTLFLRVDATFEKKNDGKVEQCFFGQNGLKWQFMWLWFSGSI